MAVILVPLKFDCLGNDHGSFHPNGFIMNNPMPQPEIKESDSILLFKKSYPCANFLKSCDDFEVLVLLARRAYLYMIGEEKWPKNLDPSYAAISSRLSDLRNEITKFLRFVHLSLKLPISSDSLNRIAKDLRFLRLLFHKFSFTLWEHTKISAALDYGKELSNDRICMSDYSRYEEHKSKLMHFHGIHCHLDIRWLFLNIVVKLEDLKRAVGCFGQDADDLPPLSFEREAAALLSDLIFVAKLSYESHYNNDIRKASAFPCACFKEIWLLLIHFPYKGEGFWARLNKALRKDHDTQAKKESDTKFSNGMSAKDLCSKRKQFLIWFISEVASIQRYNNKGEFSTSNRTIASNYEMLNGIVKEIMSEPEPPDEAGMRIMLPSIQEIVDVWGCEGSKTLIWDLWDYYNKRLNSVFSHHGKSLSTSMGVSKNGRDLVEELQVCLYGKGFKNEKSYFMWLRLLSRLLRHGQSKGVSASNLCSRIFIRFSFAQKNRLRDLSEIGLFHLVNLYLCLAISTSSPTLINKLVDVLSFVPREDMTEGKHEMIWKGYSASLIAQESLKGDLADNVQLVLSHAEWCLERKKHSEILHLVNTISFLFQKNITSVSGASKLIGPWIKSYVGVARKHAVFKLFSSFVPLLKSLYALRDFISTTPHLQELYTLLEKHVFLLVPKNIIGAELVAYFTLLSTKFGDEIFQDWSELQDCTLRGKYLSTLINTDLSAVRLQFPHIIGLALQTWVKWFCHSGRTDDTAELGKALFRLPPTSAVSVNWSCDDPLAAAMDHMGTQFKHCQSMQGKAAVRKLFFMFFYQFDKWVDQQLKEIHVNGMLSDAIFRLFYYSASLFVKCPHLIYEYNRSNPRGLLTSIVETLLLPSDLYKRDYQVPRVLKDALAGNLRIFIEGLILLDTDSDRYIGRLIRDIVQQYLPHIEDLGYDGFVAVLRNPALCAPLLKYILPLLIIPRTKPVEPTKQAIHVLKLFQKIISETPTAVERAAAEDLFEKVIAAVLEFAISLTDTESSKPPRSKAIQFIASSTASQQNRQTLVIALNASCEKHMSFNSEKWFKVVRRLGLLCPLDVRTSLSQMAENEVIEVEKRRLVPRDPVLRSHLAALVRAMSDDTMF